MTPSYADLIETLVDAGHRVDSRYGSTLELLAWPVEFWAGEMVDRKGVSLGLGFMELLQLLAGTFDAEQIRRVAPNAQAELFTAQMAYGPRIAGQVERIIEALLRKPDTRQAVLFIARPEDGPTSDQPCTTTMQFLRRNGQLDAVVQMRSWDAVRGLPYDVVVQGGLLMAVARCVGVHAGAVYARAGSLHLYDDQAGKVDKGSLGSRVIRFRLDDSVPRTWDGIVEWAGSQVETMEKVPKGIVMEVVA